MKVDLFDFELPPDLIALRPASPRDAARQLLVHSDGRLSDDHVANFASHLKPGDVLVFNNTRVISARLNGWRTGRGDSEPAIEVTLHQRKDDATWMAFAKPGRKLTVGDAITFSTDLVAVVQAKNDGGEIELEFTRRGIELDTAIAAHGIMPLPPYIAAKRPADAQDKVDYQTVFARTPGAVAAPTASLHFDVALLAKLKDIGVGVSFVTLHVGAGTFLPVKVDDVMQHKMHSEWGRVSTAAAAEIAATKAAGGRIIPVGTTALRLIETAARAGSIKPWEGATDIFIYPGFTFQVCDGLMTNFHLPRSTLFMLVSAFAGLDRMRAAYQHAIQTGYRFYSYGDSSLLHTVDPT